MQLGTAVLSSFQPYLWQSEKSAQSRDSNSGLLHNTNATQTTQPRAPSDFIQVETPHIGMGDHFGNPGAAGMGSYTDAVKRWEDIV